MSPPQKTSRTIPKRGTLRGVGGRVFTQCRKGENRKIKEENQSTGNEQILLIGDVGDGRTRIKENRGLRKSKKDRLKT